MKSKRSWKWLAPRLIGCQAGKGQTDRGIPSVSGSSVAGGPPDNVGDHDW